MGQYTINNIESRAYDLKGDIDNIYRALNTKTGKSPETLDQVPEWILSIPGLPTEEPLTITPSVDRQEFFSSDDTKYNPIEVEPVTSAIDSNIQPENIKVGISILGVNGALPGGNAKLEESFDVQPTTTDQTITPREGYVFSGGTVHAVTAEIDKNIQSENIKEGVSILGVDGTLSGNAKPEEVFDVQPTTTDQTITPTEGSVFSGGTVRAVTSSIDSNIQPENIKEGVSILGINGTLSSGGNTKPEEAFDVQPTTAEQIIIPREGYVYAGGVVRAVTAAIDSNIQPENIKEGVSILGVAGTLSSGGGSDVFMVPPELRFGNSTFTEVPSYFDFSNVTEMDSMFAGCRELATLPTLDTSKVTSMFNMLYDCPKLTSIPQLDTSKVIDMRSMFYGCKSLETIPQLDTSNVINMGEMFYYCSKLTTIPPLDTSNVKSMSNMFAYCPGLTTVEGIDFSGFTSNVAQLFGNNSNKPKITRFIVNGKINVSITNNTSIKALTAIDYDSVKSILAAADRTDNTNAKELAFNRTITDQNGELAALVSSCTSKGWTITGLTIQ